MMTCILGCQYIPSVEYFAYWLHHGDIGLESCENFQKRSWRNKTCIVSTGEPLSLTVPLRKGKHQQTNIRDVLIAYDEPWPEHHLRGLQTAYGKSAFGEEVVAGIRNVLDSPPEKLWDLNLDIIHYLTSLMKVSWKYTLTSDFIKNYPEEIFDFRSGIPAGITFLPIELVPVYPQVQRLHQSFQPNLSILDALCHLGPDTLHYLALYATQLYPNL
jgi:hypothetical protein